MNEDSRPALRAAAIAAFAVGVLLMFLHPPSLSGAGGLATLAVAVVAFFLIVAWATVALMGRDGMPEEDFERLVRRSEELAREPDLARDATEFELLVADAIDRLPPDFQGLLEHTPVVVSHRGAQVGAYGHYFGDTVARGNYEDRIVIYQDTLQRDFGHDPELLAAQVERTLRHEIAHHLGWNEAGVRGLGL
jgi:predicted Zn-dependent protease with MMP-like domain